MPVNPIELETFRIESGACPERNGMSDFVGGRRGSMVAVDRETGRELHAHIEVEVEAGRVSTRVRRSRDSASAPTITTHDRGAVWYQGEVEKQIRAAQYAERPITSMFKARTLAGVPVSPDGTMPCPLCRDLGEPWIECALCPGTGVITEGEYEAWLETNGYDTGKP